MRRRAGATFWLWAVVLGVFGLTLLSRLLGVSFHTDHYRVLTQARQVVAFGEVPIRDFLDPGMFGVIYVSAAIQYLFGYNLLGELLVSAGLLAIGAALTAYLAIRVSGSLLLGLLAGLLTAALFPRLYQYYLILLPLVGLLLCWCWVDRPCRARLAALGLATAAAALLRHDQGVYLAAASLTTIAVVRWSAGLPAVLRSVAAYVCFSALPLLPFLLFVQADPGLVPYFQSAGEYIRSEAERGQVRQPPTFRLDWSAPLIVRREPPPVQIRVRWARGITAEHRAQVEQRHGLTRGVPVGGEPTSRDWTYSLLDASEANLAALVADRGVQDTGGIDLETGGLKRWSAEPAGPWWTRGPLGQISGLLPGVLDARNAVVWLFYLFILIPIIALVRLARPSVRQTSELALVLSLVAVCLVTQRALLRETLQDRLPDAAAPALILGAWLAAQVTRPGLAPGEAAPQPLRRRHPRAGRLARLLALWLVLTMTASSAASVGREGGQLALAGLLGLVEQGPSRLGATLSRLRTSPPLEAPNGIARPRQVLARYVRACTRPSDRLLVTWFAPELYYYAERGFAAGQLFWFQRFHASPRDQQAMLDLLQGQSVPIVIDWTGREHSVHRFDQVARYLRQHYRVAREATFTDSASGSIYRVLVDSRVAPTGSYEPLSLPCYR